MIALPQSLRRVLRRSPWMFRWRFARDLLLLLLLFTCLTCYLSYVGSLLSVANPPPLPTGKTTLSIRR
ncbi:hypothetical protein JTE90_006614 [Oedothorax gibbosus]|uniref:Uncharacterized protein n=1 Tax=Oedothorax gibbosus TaxID=931172 RepID=A0AAV6U786_9ARAC|nr:hypothetical protein JTE90_006614 [Oedothorax gibbosus]